MNDLFKLKKEISETTADIEPDDVLSVKKHLKNFGYYKEPEWGMTKFSDGEMFSGIRSFQKEKNLKVDGVMKPQGETESAFNKILRHGEYASSAAQQGLSLGWADEAEGLIGGMVYGTGDAITKKGNFIDGYKRGYDKYSGERLKILQEGYEKAPVLTSASEIAGAIGSPVRLAPVSKAAPLKVVKRKNLLDALGSGMLYGAGVSKHDPKDYSKNVGLGIAGNTGGYYAGKTLFGGGLNRPIARGVTSTMLNQSVQSVYNKIRKEK